ncbi:hypothetical protein TNIN_341561 [Trichonephila inaurata madagascariensis]|uniref:Reverse transcriptase n=1 Tax=Trichonephila inaurata madagascariensis TaxID=2747483 RepID=A0A8X6JTU6_9ARAC|nr:hypothetical protein TNIN_341561 [Trichonephila inaurata madagascariensis]
MKDSSLHIHSLMILLSGKDQKEHDNLEKFMTVAKYNLTLNENKCTYSSNSVHLLGYIIQDGIIKPNPERLKTFERYACSKRLFYIVTCFRNVCPLLPMDPGVFSENTSSSWKETVSSF